MLSKADYDSGCTQIMIIQSPRSPGRCTMSESEWMSSLMRPSKTLSAALALLGSWVVFLTIVNLVIGAYSEGKKYFGLISSVGSGTLPPPLKWHL